ncbi:cytochrome c-type biogenesis protein CcmH [Cribrihabitans marinus]|uniref:Cytochrome c-type biogenesis protein CcmH n=1 Tax=Cribrihabitans marinus TaxID=1227549 RepID=A0A1H6QQP3_9RHOB|nr:c-type cytochrome biogenesis protein CcmI [Cribrihabitans marinus]SEI41555.1 cytochrome c-type biogenesis protein CcmH [Cribrihabitans marinus]
MLWVFFAVLAMSAVAMLLYPLLRSGAVETDRQAGAVAVLADQLHEVDRDAERGLISSDEAEAAKSEIKRRLLKLNRGGSAKGRSVTGARSALWISALLVPLFAGLLYTQLGSPGVPAVPFADRQDEQAEQVRITELTGRLLDRLENDPEGGPTEGWMLLGQTYMRMGRYADAASAMENVIERDDAVSAMVSQYAEALISAEDGIVTPQARKAIRRALDMDSSNPAASYYEAIALDQAGDSEDAHDLLISRLEQAAGPAPWMEIFIAQANRIGEAIGREPVSLAAFAPMAGGAPGPTRDDVAAASEMSEDDRAAFIRSMVDRLADRLAEDPDDLDGWLRLGNAYGVLGEADKAREAYEAADELAADLPSDDPRKQSIREALSELGG